MNGGASTWKKVFAAILDFLTVFDGGGYVIALVTGSTTDGGFQLNGGPAFAALALIVACFVVMPRIGGAIWQRILCTKSVRYSTEINCGAEAPWREHLVEGLFVGSVPVGPVRPDRAPARLLIGDLDPLDRAVHGPGYLKAAFPLGGRWIVGNHGQIVSVRQPYR